MSDKPRTLKDLIGDPMKPREFWITESRCTGKQKAHKTQLECWGEIQHNDNEYHVIEYAFYEKLKAEVQSLKHELKMCASLREENERLRLAMTTGDRNWFQINQERDALKDNLAECYADFKEIARVLADANRAIDEIEADLTREREAAKVMREAWRQSLELFTPNPGEELTEYGEGAKQTIKQMREQYEEALAKADEIRGGE